MSHRRWLTAGLALVAGGGIATATGVLPAVGQSSPPSTAIILRYQARIIDRGAVALPTTLVVCPANTPAFVQVNLTEHSGNGIASGVVGSSGAGVP